MSLSFAPCTWGHDRQAFSRHLEAFSPVYSTET